MADDSLSDEGHSYLHGLRLGYYRGIGKPQDIAPFRQFNFFVGANNSGKSTVLKFLQDHGKFIGNDAKTRSRMAKPGDRNSEKHKSEGAQDCIAVRGFPTARAFKRLFEGSKRRGVDETTVRQMTEVILSTEVKENRYAFWESEANAPFCIPDHLKTDESALLSLKRFSHRLEGPQQQETQSSVRICREYIAKEEASISTMPEVRTIPAFRSFKTKRDVEDERMFDGTELAQMLFKFKNHDLGEESNRTKFEKIEALLQTVIQRPNAEIQFPASADKIIVEMDEKRLELADLGTGIEEVIMIGAFCTVYDEVIICMEEPEIHLHPVLQRKLLDYLREHTANQYFIATHSAALMDMVGASVFHVVNDGNATQISLLSSRASRRLLTDELGYLPSDIVQSNSVIWVEGPSDRLYLLNWIKQIDANLREGIHFSIMFYGGRLLSNLSGDPEELDDFINLKSLNQCSAILIDSDRDTARRHLNATKKRIEKEFNDSSGFAWITKGREIENYLDHKLLEAAMQEVHPRKFGKMIGLGEFDNRLVIEHKNTKEHVTCDKVKIAQVMCRESLSMEVLDLKQQLYALVAFLRKANGLD